MTSRKVRIVTWNILHGMDYRTGVVDLDATAAALRAYDADVVALQEVDRFLPRSGDVDQTAQLAAELGMHAAFSPSLLGSPDSAWTAARHLDTGGAAYGIALLSRFPITATRRLRLPGGGDGQRSADATPLRPGWDNEPRWALQCKLDVEGSPLSVTCTHLSYMPWRGVRQLARVMVAARSTGDPAVVLGDLNLPRPLVRALTPGWSYAGGGKTHPADEPRLQLDHVVVRGLRAIDHRLGDPAASDHLPVIVDAELPVR